MSRTTSYPLTRTSHPSSLAQISNQIDFLKIESKELFKMDLPQELERVCALFEIAKAIFLSSPTYENSSGKFIITSPEQETAQKVIKGILFKTDQTIRMLYDCFGDTSFNGKPTYSSYLEFTAYTKDITLDQQTAFIQNFLYFYPFSDRTKQDFSKQFPQGLQKLTQEVEKIAKATPFFSIAFPLSKNPAICLNELKVFLEASFKEKTLRERNAFLSSLINYLYTTFERINLEQEHIYIYAELLDYLFKTLEQDPYCDLCSTKPSLTVEKDRVTLFVLMNFFKEFFHFFFRDKNPQCFPRFQSKTLQFFEPCFKNINEKTLSFFVKKTSFPQEIKYFIEPIFHLPLQSILNEWKTLLQRSSSLYRKIQNSPLNEDASFKAEIVCIKNEIQQFLLTYETLVIGDFFDLLIMHKNAYLNTIQLLNKDPECWSQWGFPLLLLAKKSIESNYHHSKEMAINLFEDLILEVPDLLPEQKAFFFLCYAEKHYPKQGLDGSFTKLYLSAEKKDFGWDKFKDWLENIFYCSDERWEYFTQDKSDLEDFLTGLSKHNLPKDSTSIEIFSTNNFSENHPFCNHLHPLYPIKDNLFIYAKRYLEKTRSF